MSKINDIIHNYLWSITEKNPKKTRDISREGKLYLRRFYHTPRRLDENGEETGEYKGFGRYLHYFYRGDVDKELHSHPWKWAFSFVLCGGYLEERRVFDKKTNKYKVITRKVRPGTINIIRAKDFHRVVKESETPHTWTIFITGPRIQDWSFWDQETGEYVPQGKFVNQADQGYKK